MASFVSEKVKRERQIAERAKLLISNHNKEYKGKENKKLNHEQVLKKSKNILKLKDFWIRDPKEWTSKSFNLSRQIIDFATWVLCEYPVPLFMYKLFIPSPRDLRGNTSMMSLEEIYLDWFITIGQGMSFRKSSKDFFTSKQAHLFLKAPKNNSISANILWAKCELFYANKYVKYILCNNWESRVSSTNKHIWDKIINFYSKYENIDKNTIQDTMDFIFNSFNTNRNFSLSGRTLNSIIQLSNEWHNERQITKGIGFESWNGLPIPDWKWDVTEEDLDVWYITQILDSKKLLHEGRVMRHCVGSYSTYCKTGQTGIFTMSHKFYGQTSKLLTIEVHNNFKIVQARGKCNKDPDKEEIKTLKKWAADIGLQLLL